MNKEKEQSLSLLVVGNDDSVFDFSSPLFQKVSSYAKIFGCLTIFCRTRKIVSAAPILQGPLTIYAIYANNPFVFLVRALVLGRRMLKRGSVGFRIITADNPFEEGLVAWLLAHLYHLPLQLQIHTDIMSPFFRHASWKERMRYMLARFLIPRADCIRVVSERIRRTLTFSFPALGERGSSKRVGRQFPTSKTVVLPIYTDTAKFFCAKPNPATEERFKNYDFRIVAVGRFVDKEKNFSMLIEVMRDFVCVCPGALFVLVGDGPDRESYQLQITNYQLEKNVILEPWRTDLPSFYKSFDLFLLSSNYEGWGRVIIEAMAAGLPVIMTDVGLAGEVVKDGENGMVVPVGDKKAFVSILKELAQDSVKRMRLKNAASKTVLVLSPKTQEEYNLLYKESLTGVYRNPP